ncbi:Bacteriophage Gp15 protein [Lacrimispora sphenoides]|jgi:hypothetical protein|nr:Gp15 family bacteriophage protein [Lacrimispora sphenoides]SEU06345.1 Bacteriophage Gp15 protein [Lacrimispora sphenoides]
MIGALPASLNVGGEEYPVETDFRNILIGLTACADPEYNDRERLYILMKRLFRDRLNEIPEDYITEAAEKAKWFIDCGQVVEDKKPPLKVIDWEQDEPIIFPAINKLAHRESGPWNISIGGPLWVTLWKLKREPFPWFWESGRRLQRERSWRNGKKNFIVTTKLFEILRPGTRRKNRQRLII